MYDCIEVGDPVAESPVGAGKITDFTERGYPRVNHVAVVWCRLTDGATYDPHNKVGGSRQGRPQETPNTCGGR